MVYSIDDTQFYLSMTLEARVLVVKRYAETSLTAGRSLARSALLAFFVVFAGAAQADLYSINSIKVDETAEDAVQAKKKALGDGQLRAFRTLMRRLTRADDRQDLPDISLNDVARLMDSMSVENERSSGTRYLATLTIKFRPDNIRDMLVQSRVPFADKQAPGALLLTIWKEGGKTTIWDPPNPWRDAWDRLNVENSITPLFMPLGDLTDIETITADDVLLGDGEKIQRMKDRYALDSILIAVAEPVAGGIRATIKGTTAAGEFAYDNVFTGAGAATGEGADGGAEKPEPVNAAFDEAAQTFLEAIEEGWKTKNVKLGRADGSIMTMSVPFSSLGEWNNIRQTITATSGVGSLEVKRLSSRGAVVDVVFSGNLRELNDQFAQSGFELSDIGDTWVLQKR